MTEFGPVEEVVRFLCPFCWQEISILVDRSVLEQRFIEDCEVCCRPVSFRASIDSDGRLTLELERAQDS